MKISQLYVYPIKSLRGEALSASVATYRGLLYDRRFMLQRVSDLATMNVSQVTEMCLFTTQISYPDPPTNTTGGFITVTFAMPNEEKKSSQIQVPLQPDCSELEPLTVTIYSSPTKAYNMGPTYNSWFSSCFGFDVTLIYIGENRRKVLGNMPPSVTYGPQSTSAASNGGSWFSSLTSSIPYLSTLTGFTSPSIPGIDEGIHFSECAPYLVVTDKSYQNANDRLPANETMDITKFRPNIVLEGAVEAFEEDYWAELAVEPTNEDLGQLQQKPRTALKIVLTQNCARCNSINVDYGTGKVAAAEAGSMLKKLQRDRRVDKGAKWSPIFGRYGFLDRVSDADGEGSTVLAVGDEVTVVRRNPERSHFMWPKLSTEHG